MQKTKTLLLTILSTILMLTFVGPSWAQEMAVHDEIRERIERYRMSGRLVVDGVDIATTDVLWRLYEDDSHTPPEDMSTLLETENAY